jgi:TetR/AcrR family transcriptional repressor of mexJK operon
MTPEQVTSRTKVKRAQILAAARRLFLQQGFAQTSTEAIRLEAGVSKETLYRYYDSKEDLFADVLQQMTLEQIPQADVESLPGLEDRESLRLALLQLVQKLVAVMMQPAYLGLLRIIVAETPRFPQLGALFRVTVPEQSLASLTALFRQMQDLKGGVALDGEAAARMLLGSLLTYALLDGLLATEGTPSAPQPERLAAIVDLLLRAISTQDTKEIFSHDESTE